MSHQFTWTPSTNYAKATKPRTKTVKFGGGYSQRVPDSYNNIDMSWSLTFQNRPFAEANLILDFLEDKRGSESFEFTSQDSPTVHKVICAEWSDVVTSPFSKTISCTFVKVYE